ncbi:MAG: type IV pilus assembly protein PilM [Patescibacteria group bacterium]|nr:MAG: type IV pilus assembly protein PilM [Patescibacteria group bacterium]
MANFLNKIIGLGARKKEGSVLGVDIGSSAIKIVQLKKEKGRAVLENYGELALGPYAGFGVGQATNLPKEKIIEALTDLFREAGITTKNAGISIPMGATMISLIEMPALPEKQLATSIPIEARKYIPVPISEVVIDWWVIPQRGESKEASSPGKSTIDVLVAAIHNETMRTYQEIKEKMGLMDGFFEIEIFSAIRSVADSEAPLIMIADMGAGTTKLAMVEYGIVRNTHTISKGSQDITSMLSKSMGISIAKAEEVKRSFGLTGELGGKKLEDIGGLSLGHIFSEVNSVLLNYQKRYNKTVDKVILTGGGALLKGMLEMAKNNLKTEVVVGDPFTKVESPAFLEETFQEVGPEFSVAIGIALKALQGR